MAEAWIPLMRAALFNQLKLNKFYACPEANCSIIYGPMPARFENGMVSTTEWQADASLWKDDRFFDAGTFCLPSTLPQVSLEAYTVKYDVETGIHDVFLTMKGILELSTISASNQFSHVAEFSNGVMKAVPRRGNSGVSSHVISDRHTNSSERATVDVQEASIEEQMIVSDNLGAVYSSIKCPGKANSLNVLTDLGLEDAIPPSVSSASETSSDDGANTQSEPGTNATSPTLSLPQDLLELRARQEEASTTIPALDLEQKPSNSKLWQCIPFQWLDMAISDRQYFHWKEIQEKEEPDSVQEDKTIAEKEITAVGTSNDWLEDLDLDMIFGQAATELDDEGLSQEAIVLDDETVNEKNDIDPVGTSNDDQHDGPEFHHLNLLRNRVYQASRTPSALSLWVTMTSKRRVQLKDSVSLKAVVSAQAAKWVDPVLLQEGVSVPEEVREPGNATAYRNFLTGLTTIQYEPCGTWQSETHDCEQERPNAMDSETGEILKDAYIESYGFPGIQRPYFVEEGDDHWSYSFPDPQKKQQKGWESLDRLGNSNLRFVLNEDSITNWHAPAATPTSYEVAEPADVNEDENGYVEDNFVFPAEESELGDRPGACEAGERYEEASSLRSLLALSSMTRGAISPPNEGRFFTPRVREDPEEPDGWSDSLDGECWETDENGAFVSPRKGKERLRSEMGEDLPSGTQSADEDSPELSNMSLGQLTSPKAQRDMVAAFKICHHLIVDLPPTGIFQLPESDLGTMIPTEDATEGHNAHPMPVEELSTQEDVLQADLSLPYYKYNDVLETPLHLNLAVTVGQAGRELARWLTENMLW